ncbi:MAG TPA: hypothetical protein VF449_05760 [Parvibaculum sp.]
MRNRFGLAVLLGIATFAMTVWLGAIGPRQMAHPAPGDGRSPVIAFEMVSSVDQLAPVIGENRAGYVALRDAMDKVNRIDFLYMATYGLFIAAFFWAVAQAKGDRRWLIASALGIVAALGDVRENIALLALTQDGADAASNIHALVIATWTKWFALGLTSALAAHAMFTTPETPILRYVGAVAGAIALAFTVAAYFDQVGYPQLMALGIFLTWLMQGIYAFRRSRAAA